MEGDGARRRGRVRNKILKRDLYSCGRGRSGAGGRGLALPTKELHHDGVLLCCRVQRVDRPTHGAETVPGDREAELVKAGDLPMPFGLEAEVLVAVTWSRVGGLSNPNTVSRRRGLEEAAYEPKQKAAGRMANGMTLCASSGWGGLRPRFPREADNQLFWRHRAPALTHPSSACAITA